jgi:hypothetical protein
MPEGGWIRNVGKAEPALVISQEPGGAAQGNPALAINQADPNGPALLIKSAGSLIDLQTVAVASRFKVDAAGAMTVGGTDIQPGFLPSDVGLIAWNFDPFVGAVSQSTTTNGTIYLAQFILRRSQTITAGAFALAVAASAVTSNQNFIALVDSAGVIRGATAAGAIDVATATAGWISQAFVTPYVNAPAGK